MGRSGSLMLTCVTVFAAAMVFFFSTNAQAKRVCPVYVPGQAMAAGCWTLLPPRAGTPMVTDSSGLPTNMAFGVWSDTDQGFTAIPQTVVYDSASLGQLDCENLSYRTDVVRCNVHFHLKFTLNMSQVLTARNGHMAVILGPAPCCQGAADTVHLDEWSGYTYPGNLPSQAALDGGNGLKYWYVVNSASIDGTHVIENEPWINAAQILDTNGDTYHHLQIEWRGGYENMLVCKNPAQTGCA